jgi:hypothetical protein
MPYTTLQLGQQYEVFRKFQSYSQRLSCAHRW